ncbi:hypothetical protein HYH02_000882 [Chlamydomonas schloesseri]|uniref:Uncharacterized protein n=1 Tax=Chlamydomonas schloesseri TaxID=2026947 RepID=A0A835WX55_9CHLO|nr:hypothetical protein HYH02_000882 [Chlamydomonas schloesseri]|eukprot:KAG2455057.1 hypothetical protein HYH02_000882 [Chlamydomonas schloesseri]
MGPPATGALLSPARLTQAFSSLGPAAGSGGPRSPSASITVTPTSGTGEPMSAPAAPYTGAAAPVQRPMTSAHTPKTPSPSRVAASPAAAGSLWSSGQAAGNGGNGGSSSGGGGRNARRVQYDSAVKGAGGGGSGGGAGETPLNYQPPLPPRGPLFTGPRPASGATGSRGGSGAGATSATPTPRGGGGGGGGARGGSGASSASPTPRDSYAGGGGGGLNSFTAAGNAAVAMGRARSALGSRPTSTKRLSVGGAQGSFTSMGSGVTVACGIGGAAGTAGGIDMGRLIAIQKLLDEFSDDDGDAGGSSPNGPFPGGGGGGGMRFSDASGAGIPGVRSRRPSSSGYNPRDSDGSGGAGMGGGGGGGASGLRSLAALRDKGDMHMWMPAVSAVKGSLEEHAQRLRERTDVTQSLRKWAEQVLEEAASHAPSRLKGVAASALQPAGAAGGAAVEPPGLSEEDADQADIDEERRLAAALAARPDGAGMGAQLRAHFNNVVADEVARKFDAMRATWNEEVSAEMEELKELREAHKELRARFQDSKEALDKANTKMEMMRRQMGPAGAAAMAGLTGTSSPTARSSAASPERHNHHDGLNVHHSPDAAHGASHGGSHGPGHGRAHGASHAEEDLLHDRVANIGSRRGTPLASHAGEGALFSNAELQAQLRKQAEQLAANTVRLQEAELALIKSKQDKTHLEQELAAAKGAAVKAGAGGGAKGGARSKASAGGRSGGGKVSASDKAAADKAERLLQAEVDKLGKELAAIKMEATTKGREAAERAAELEKTRKELVGAQDSLSAALHQLSALREERDKDHKRADAAEAAAADARATAMAEAQAAARAAAAASAVEAESGGGGAAAAATEAAAEEMSAALHELGRQRDEAVQAAGEWEALAGSLQQQVADLQQELQQQSLQQPSAAQSSHAEGSWASGSGGGGGAGGDDDDGGGGQESQPAPVLAVPGAEAIPGLRAVVATSEGGMQTTPRLPQPQHAELANHSVQTSARGTPRRRDSAGYASARGGGGGSGGASASGEAAGAGAASTVATAALVLELQRRLPAVIQHVLVGADAGPLTETEPGDASGNTTAGPAEAAAAAAMEVVRSELLRCLAGLAGIGGGVGVDGAEGSAGLNVLVLSTVEPAAVSGGAASARGLPPAGGAAATAAVPALNLSALAQGQPLQAGVGAPGASSGGASAEQAAARATAEAAASGAAAAFSSRGGSALSSARVVVAAGGSGGSSGRASAPTAVIVDGVTFVPLGFKGGAAAGRPAVQGVALLDGHGLVLQPQPQHHQQQLPPQIQAQQLQQSAAAVPSATSIPMRDARSASAAGPTAASLADAGHMTVTLPGPRSSLVVASAARRRKSAFASLHSNYLTPPNPNAAATSDGEGAVAGASDDDSAAVTAQVAQLGPPQPSAAGSGAASVRALRSAGAGGGASTGDGLMYSHMQQHGPAAVYVDPALASALQVGPISPAAARAAGAGPGALAVDGTATGPSPWDHGLGSTSQQSMLLRRPRSAAARALESARQQLAVAAAAQQQAAYGGGGGYVGGLARMPRRPASAALQPFGGGVSGMGALQQQQQIQMLQAQMQAQMQGWVVDASGAQPISEGVDAGPSGAVASARDGSPQRPSVSFMLAEAGAKVRNIAATPQKGIQLPGRLRSAPTRSQALAAAGGRVGSGGATQGFPDEPVAPQAAVTGNALPGPGLSPGFRELQLHVGRDAAVATHFAPPPLEPGSAVSGEDGGGSPRHGGLQPQASASELPVNAAELAALARELMLAQERAAAELEAAQSTQRELADEVASSRRQWVDEAKRARALEAELARVRGQLLSMGVGEPHRPPA